MKEEMIFHIKYNNKDRKFICKEHRSYFYVVTDSDAF